MLPFISLSLMQNVPQPSPLREALSGVAGSTSLACWIVLLLPQLIEQWKTKSAEGIAIGFIATWFVGDVTNLTGSIWAGLLPEVIFLAGWFCFADSLIMISYFYYQHKAKVRREALRHRSSSSAETDPTQPLLDRRNSASRRKSSSHRRRDSLTSVVADPSLTGHFFSKYILPVLFVVGAGVIGYFISATPSSDSGDGGEGDSGDQSAAGAQVLGYISAVLYLGARIPQIIQNHKKQSVYGLSLLFFIFSILGNLTYAAQILLYRSDWDYVVLNFPWLLGSLGTIFEDCIIFLQFYIYKDSALGDSAILD